MKGMTKKFSTSQMALEEMATESFLDLNPIPLDVVDQAIDVLWKGQER